MRRWAKLHPATDLNEPGRAVTGIHGLGSTLNIGHVHISNEHASEATNPNICRHKLTSRRCIAYSKLTYKTKLS